LKNYFEKNKEKYAWKNSVNGVIFYAADIATAQKLAAQIRSKPSTWHELVAGLSDKVTADSGRFEIAQIPHNGALVVKANTVTAPVLNQSDNTASFAYIQSVYTKPALRNFEEAKGLVINDYQNEVEQKWIADLKKKYPVTVNQQVWEQVQQSAIK
jgi:peptidyl-prolyl cis-trans isomerase SurA